MCLLFADGYFGTAINQPGLLTIPTPGQQPAGQPHPQFPKASGTPYWLEFPVMIPVILQWVPLALMLPPT